MERFGDNLYRVMGLHRLTAAELRTFIDVSAQTLSEWKRGKSPNLSTLLRVAEFFEIHGDRLVNAPFTELLTSELCDHDRFGGWNTRSGLTQRRSGRSNPASP